LRVKKVGWGKGRRKEEKSKIRSLDGALGFRKGTNTPESWKTNTRAKETQERRKEPTICRRIIYPRGQRKKKDEEKGVCNEGFVLGGKMQVGQQRKAPRLQQLR
jgi:hypothetical protein